MKYPRISDELRRHVLADYAAIMNRYGPESREAEEYRLAFSYVDREFSELANTAKALKLGIERRNQTAGD